MISQVDQKIKRSLARIEIPTGGGANAGQSSEMAAALNAPEMNAFQQEAAHQRIDQLEQKINFFIEKAEKLGEEGKIDESEAVMKEVDKLKIQKTELEALSDPLLAQQARIDKNAMKVCDICGGLQTASDTDKRMVMHVEGKLHKGYAKIRKVLAELRQKRDDYRKQGDRLGGRRSRSRSLSPSSKARGGNRQGNNGSSQLPAEKFDDGFNFSSKKLGTGANCHEGTTIRFSDYAIQMNQESNEQVVLQSIEKLGKEWGYYKRNIDKQRREQQNELKRKEEEKNRQARYEDRSGGNGGGGGYREFRRPSSPPRGERGGGAREYRTGPPN